MATAYESIVIRVRVRSDNIHMNFRESMKKYFWLPLVTLFFVFHMLGGTAFAAQVDESIRTLPLNEAGDEVVIPLDEFLTGERLFKAVCADCHNQGGTKPNPNITLSLEDLATALPARDNLAGLVDYLNNPTTYDGEVSIALFHPSTQSAAIYSEMRGLSQDDLEAISSYILIQGRLEPDRWGGGKVYF